jgi:hypothetical protein
MTTFNADPRQLQALPATLRGHLDRVATMRTVVFRDQRTTPADSTLPESDSLTSPFPKAVLLIALHLLFCPAALRAVSSRHFTIPEMCAFSTASAFQQPSIGSSLTHRIGRRPDPWQYPDWSRLNPDGTFGNRFDDPDGEYRPSSTLRLLAPDASSRH